MPEWEYDTTSHRYRDRATGRYLAPTAMRELRDDFAERSRQSLAGLTAGLVSGDRTLGAWVREMRERVRLITLAEYTFGRGGFRSMERPDRQAVDALVREQWAYLDGFARDVAAGKLSPAQISARATLYANASRRAYETGRAASRSIVLPVMPADGGTVCKANCLCTWEVVEETDALVTLAWTLHAAESCPDCVERSNRYSGLVVVKGG